MVRWLQDAYGLDGYGAHLLLGMCVEYEVGNAFDPAYTMVCKVAKGVLRQIAAETNRLQLSAQVRSDILPEEG